MQSSVWRVNIFHPQLPKISSSFSLHSHSILCPLPLKNKPLQSWLKFYMNKSSGCFLFIVPSCFLYHMKLPNSFGQFHCLIIGSFFSVLIWISLIYSFSFWKLYCSYLLWSSSFQILGYSCQDSLGLINHPKLSFSILWNENIGIGSMSDGVPFAKFIAGFNWCQGNWTVFTAFLSYHI